MYKGTTNYKLLEAYVAKIIGYSTTNLFRKIAKASTKEDSTVKKIDKCLQKGAFGKKKKKKKKKKRKKDCRGALIKKMETFSSPFQKNNVPSLDIFLFLQSGRYHHIPCGRFLVVYWVGWGS